MKRKSRESNYAPRSIERAIFGILGSVVFLGGLYLTGPWYLDTNLGIKTPIISLLNYPNGVTAFGTLLILDGLALFYATVGRGTYYARITANALLAGFLLRLYALIGVFLTLESWRPPSYLSQMAVVALFGGMWVWVKVSDRPVK